MPQKTSKKVYKKKNIKKKTKNVYKQKTKKHGKIAEKRVKKHYVNN